MNSRHLYFLVLLILVPGVSHSGDFKTSGQFRARAAGQEKTDFSNSLSYSELRLRMGIEWSPSSELGVLFQPQVATRLGSGVYTGTSASGNTFQETSGSVVDPALGVHQAYGAWVPFENARLKIGRQILAFGDELVLGALEWAVAGRSFDAIRAGWTWGEGTLDLFGAKLRETNSTVSSSGDRDFFGVYHTWKVADWLRAFDLYGFGLIDGTGSTPTNLWVAGFRVKSAVDAFDYRAEVTQNFQAYTGTQANIELGYTLPVTMNPRLGGEFFWAGSDYFQLFPTAHKFLGAADVLGRRNLMGFSLKLGAEVIDGVRVDVDYFSFYRARLDQPAYRLNGLTALGAAAGSTSGMIGSEVDLNLRARVKDAMTISGGASLFLAGAYVRDQLPALTPTFYYAQMEITF